MELLFIIAFAALYTFLTWKNQLLGLSFIVLLLPTYLIRFSIGPLPSTLLELMILISFFIFIFHKRKKLFSTSSNYRWLIFLLLFFASLSVVVAPDRIAALGVWKAYFIEPIMFFIVLINLVKTKRDWSYIINALGLAAIAVASFAIYQKFTGQFIFNELWQAADTRRVTSFFGFPNAVGLFLAPIVVLFSGRCWLHIQKMWSRYTDQKYKYVTFDRSDLLELLINISVFVTGSLAIFFANSEGALVATGVGLIFLGLFMKRLRIPTLIVLSASLLVFFLLPSVNQFVTEKASFQDYSGNIRVVIWQETIQMLEDSPIFGTGLAGFQSGIEPYHHANKIFEIYLYPHQIILNFWAEIGLLGLVTMLLLIIKFFTNYLKVRKGDNQQFYLVLMAAFIAVLVHGLVDVPYFKNDLAVLWWLLFGLSWILIKEKKLLKE